MTTTMIDAETLMEAVMEAAYEAFLGQRVRFAADDHGPLISGAEPVVDFRRAGAVPVWGSSGRRVLHPNAAVRATLAVLVGRDPATADLVAVRSATRLCNHLALRRVVLAPVGEHDDVIDLESVSAYRAGLESAADAALDRAADAR
jgi:hypothetical protein